MTRRHWYGFVLFAIIGTLAGLLELGYRLVIDSETT